MNKRLASILALGFFLTLGIIFEGVYPSQMARAVTADTLLGSAVVSDEKEVNYSATIYQEGDRVDGIYSGAPYGVEGSSQWPGDTSERYSGSIVAVIKEETVTYPDGGKTVYAYFKDYGFYAWVDKAALVDMKPYDTIINQETVAYSNVVTGKVGNLYYDGPYNTNPDTLNRSEDISYIADQLVEVSELATVQGSTGELTTWAKVTTETGLTFWLDNSCLSSPDQAAYLDQPTDGRRYGASIYQKSGRQDGLYPDSESMSGRSPFLPGLSSKSVSPNLNAVAYDGRNVEVLGERVVHYPDGGTTTYARILITDGQLYSYYWIDKAALVPNPYDYVTEDQLIDSPSFNQEISARPADAYFISGPYNTSEDTQVPAGPLSQYNGYKVKLLERKVVTSKILQVGLRPDGKPYYYPTYTIWAQVELEDGTKFWIDSAAVLPLE